MKRALPRYLAKRSSRTPAKHEPQSSTILPGPTPAPRCQSVILSANQWITLGKEAAAGGDGLEVRWKWWCCGMTPSVISVAGGPPYVWVKALLSAFPLWGFREMGVPPVHHPYFSGSSHCKSSIWGYPHFRKPPFHSKSLLTIINHH